MTIIQLERENIIEYVKVNDYIRKNNNTWIYESDNFSIFTEKTDFKCFLLKSMKIYYFQKKYFNFRQKNIILDNTAKFLIKENGIWQSFHI